MNIQVAEVKLTYKSNQKPSERPKIDGSQTAEKIFRAISEYNENIEYCELVYAMYLNRSNKVLSVSKIGEGGVAGCVMDVKKILQAAILQNASGIILSHNHPSGNEKPSDADKQLTKKIKQAAELLDITVFDHIILTPESYFSFADEGII